MYCVDILDALTKDFFARKGNAIDEAVEINEVQLAPDRPGYEPVSSTLWRQREDYCARLIQSAWRKHKTIRLKGEEADENLSSAIIVDEDGGPKVVIQNPCSKSPSIASRVTDV